jgi:hypothetical protein
VDENKRLKLVDIGYEIRPSCLTCVHGRFENPNEVFGTCKKHEYRHMKHSEKRRELSVFKAGSCIDHELSPDVEALIHGFKEFIK